MRLHHIGYVVSSITQFEKKLLFESKMNEVFDANQQAILSVYQNFSNSFIELIQPLNEKAYTWNALKRNGNHYHHLCYSIANRIELNKIIEHEKMIEIIKSLPAILFNNSEVAFYFTRNKQIVEFIIESNDNSIHNTEFK